MTTQALTAGSLSVGDRVVAVADLRKHPDGPVWVKKGEEVGIVREYGVGNCIAGVALQDGREGDWAKSCFRLAPTAPVEASGSEREHGPKCWGMTSASDEMAHCYCGSTDIRPQPSGETREAVARIIDPKAWDFRDCQHEAIDRIPDLSDDERARLKRSSEMYVEPSLTKADTIIALGGQHSGGEGDTAFKIASDLHAAYEQLIYGLPKYLEAENLTDEENMIREAYTTLDVTAHRLAALSTTPARAEAQDEGAAGSDAVSHHAKTDADPVVSMLRDVAERLERPEPDLLGARVGVQAVRLAVSSRLLTHPSPTPAADADRVRIAVELINAKINAPLTGPTHGAWDRGRIAGLKEALAALKSTAAKEGEKK